MFMNCNWQVYFKFNLLGILFFSDYSNKVVPGGSCMAMLKKSRLELIVKLNGSLLNCSPGLDFTYCMIMYVCTHVCVGA